MVNDRPRLVNDLKSMLPRSIAEIDIFPICRIKKFFKTADLEKFLAVIHHRPAGSENRKIWFAFIFNFNFRIALMNTYKAAIEFADLSLSTAIAFFQIENLAMNSENVRVGKLFGQRPDGIFTNLDIVIQQKHKRVF